MSETLLKELKKKQHLAQVMGNKSGANMLEEEIRKVIRGMSSTRDSK